MSSVSWDGIHLSNVGGKGTITLDPGWSVVNTVDGGFGILHDGVLKSNIYPSTLRVKDLDVVGLLKSVADTGDTPAGLHWFELIETWDRLGAVFAKEEDED